MRDATRKVGDDDEKRNSEDNTRNGEAFSRMMNEAADKECCRVIFILMISIFIFCFHLLFHPRMVFCSWKKFKNFAENRERLGFEKCELLSGTKVEGEIADKTQNFSYFYGRKV